MLYHHFLIVNIHLFFVTNCGKKSGTQAPMTAGQAKAEREKAERAARLAGQVISQFSKPKPETRSSVSGLRVSVVRCRVSPTRQMCFGFRVQTRNPDVFFGLRFKPRPEAQNLVLVAGQAEAEREKAERAARLAGQVIPGFKSRHLGFGFRF